jgi:hypothetical protein
MKTTQALNILAFIGVIIVNALANALPINGFNTGELSDMYPNLFVPVGLTFSVWGVIYLLLLGYIISQSLSLFNGKSTPDFVERIGGLFLVNCLANMSWIVLWHYQMTLIAFGIMLVILATLISIYQKLEIGKREASKRELWTAHIPFSVYLGWISIATIANLTAVLVDMGWQGGVIGEASWAIIMIIIGGLLGFFILTTRKDVAFGLVLAWAIIGINIKRITSEPFYANIAITASVIAVLLLIYSIFTLIKNLRKT